MKKCKEDKFETEWIRKKKKKSHDKVESGQNSLKFFE